MIDKTGGVDPVYPVRFNKTYKVNGAHDDGRSTGRDAVTISKFSALVERGRACAMALPDVRTDRVAQAKSLLDAGETPGVGDIASAMINSAVKGQM